MQWIEDPWLVTNGGSLRVRAFAEALNALGHDVTCGFWGPAGNAAGPEGIVRHGTTAHAEDPREPGRIRRVKRELLPVPLAVAAKKIHPRLAAQNWDLCLTTEMWLLGALPPSRMLWLDHSDLLSRVAQTAARQRAFPANVTARAQGLLLARSEQRGSNRADVVTTAGWGDSQIVSATSPGPDTWLPTPIAQRPVNPPGEAVPTMGMFGDFAHLPNLDAVDVLRTWLSHGLAEGARILVGGRGSEKLSLPDGVQALGPVNSGDDFYKLVDIVLCPVRIGGGMKVKAVEALFAGRPVIVHPHVMDGFPKDVQAKFAVYEKGLRAADLLPAAGVTDDPVLKPFEPSYFQHLVEERLDAAVKRLW